MADRASVPARIAIVGGGFSGAVTAVQLVRKLPGPATIHVIEPRPALGCGVAYSATDPDHRINVPASRMTVIAEEPGAFEAWMRETDTLASDPSAIWHDGSAFPQRAVFGRYVSELVAKAASARPDVALSHHPSIVIDIAARAGGFLLRLADGAALPVDVAVLAVSHPPPALPPALSAAQAAGAPLIADPWQHRALDVIPADARVVVVGTGLTMADTVSTLARRGHRGPIVAVSRRGLLSRGHAFKNVVARDWFATASPPRTAREACRTVRAQVSAAAAAGQPWQAVFDDIRAHAPRLWAALSETERSRLVRHVRPFWDVHRFRVAPQAEAAIAALRAAGQLTIRAASLRGADWDGTQLHVHVHPRGAPASELVTIDADVAVIVTGPAHAGVISTNPALTALARAGLVRPDSLGLGLDVDERGLAIGRDGTVHGHLFVAGPLARARVGELMGLPQVSEHAALVAEMVSATTGAWRRAVSDDAANRAAGAGAVAAYPTP